MLKAISYQNKVQKGWVREAILNLLVKEPLTLSKIAEKLDISKSTVSYHIASLLKRGIIEIIDTKLGRGGTITKLYSLKNSSLIVLPSIRDEGEHLRRISEVFEIKKMEWENKPGGIKGIDVITFLYHLFMNLHYIVRQTHTSIVEEYGFKIGKVISKDLIGGTLKRTVLELHGFLKERGMVNSSLIFPQQGGAILLCTNCFESRQHGGLVCDFVLGLIRGAIQAKKGTGFFVERIKIGAMPFCAIAIGRGSPRNISWMSNLILSNAFGMSSSIRV